MNKKLLINIREEAFSMCNTQENNLLKTNEVFEKFAELIVRQCAGINYNSPFMDGEFHAKEVLEYFGVE